MATTFSMLTIINAALLARGLDTVNENDGSDEWRVCAQNWPQIVESELEEGNYHFTMNSEMSLTRTDGSYGYDDAYLVPAAALYVRNVWRMSDDRRIETDWMQAGSYVHVNSDDGVLIEYVSSEEPAVWSANFVLGVQRMIEAIILRSLLGETGEAQTAVAEALSYFQRARSKSSASRSTDAPVAQPSGIISARVRRA